MGSFKVKLVAYFVLLSLLPLTAAFWGFSTVAARAETRRVDARLQLRSGLDRDDHVVLLRKGAVAAGLPPGDEVDVAPGGPRTAKIGRTRYRVLVAGTLEEQRSATLGVVSPQGKIDAGNWESER